jgi:site-specific DNA-methyltransferase (adenine-specific)
MDRLIEQSVVVDAIITDPPYGTTACKWDSIIDFDEMWLRLNKLIKPDGAIVLFGSEPFSSALRMSNIKNYKYDWVWKKRLADNVFFAESQPMKIHENILIFNSSKENFFPIKTEEGKNPRSIIDISNANRKGNTHPAQKPIPLMEYLIKTYTNEDEVVLDFTAGSFSTGVACVDTNRKGIMIEQDDKYFDVGVDRVETQLKVAT